MVSVHRPPAALANLVRVADPTEGGREIAIAKDLLVQDELGRAALTEAQDYIDSLLADASVANADLKGLLNRLDGWNWRTLFEFGADAKAARRYLEALSRALVREET